MLTTLKIMLKPNKIQETQLVKSSSTARFIYNWALNIQLENYKSGGKFINDSILRKQLTKLKQTEEYSWLFDVSNNIAKQSIKDLCLAYKNFFNTQKNPKTKGFTKKTIEKSKRQNRELTSYDLQGHPKFKSKKYDKLSFYNDPITLCVKKDKVLLEKIGWVKTNELLPEKLSQLDKAVKFYNPRITFDGKYWYISVGIDKETPVVELTDNVLGIDLGIKKLAVTSDNEVYVNINKSTKVKNLKKKLRRLQRQVSRKYLMTKEVEKGNDENKSGKDKSRFKKTKNIIKLEEKIKLINRRLNNIRNNYLHQITTKIAKTKPSQVVMEDLNIKGMMKNRHLSKAIGEQGFNKFNTYMKYKCLNQGTEFVLANRYYPSSKLCSLCGTKKSDLKLKDRIYKCSNVECELHRNPIDRDYNASLNLSRYIA